MIGVLLDGLVVVGERVLIRVPSVVYMASLYVGLAIRGGSDAERVVVGFSPLILLFY